MALQLTLDHALQIVTEPGYFHRISSEAWERALNPVGATGAKAFWSDQATRTIMLMPQQLKAGWLNTAEQFDSIVGLVDRGSGFLATHPTNQTLFAIFEANIKQNPDNPWVHYRPTTSGSFLELLVQLGIVALEAKSGFPFTTTDSRVLAYTLDTVPGNQAWYIRWAQADTQADSPSIFGLTIGQYALHFVGDLMEIHEDTSPSKDRTAWRRIMSANMFGSGINPLGANGNGNRPTVAEVQRDERAILWLPFRRNLVYIEGSGGRWALLQTRNEPRLNGKEGDEEDWDIVDDSKVLVWGLTSSVGRFQLQKVKWHTAATQTQLPTFTLDYAPGTALTSANIIVDGDEKRGTDIAFTVPVTPPGYDNVVNHLDTCPAVTTDGTAQTRTYGVTFTLTPSSDDRFTPFLYGADVRLERAVGTWAIGGITFGDEGEDVTKIVSAKFRSDIENPEQTEMEAEVLDYDPFPLGTRVYRSSYPFLLQETPGPVTHFLGVSRPTVVRPIHHGTDRPRRLTMRGNSLWRWLQDTPLRDQRDWTGNGHIATVHFIVGQAGIDTSGFDGPAIGSEWDFPLGGVTTTHPQTGALKPHWKPSPEDTAATFITRIAKQHSGFRVGFYPNGQFYYLPTDPWAYTASEETFHFSRDANPNDPCYESPVEFEVTEPEANVVQVIATAPTGGTLRSALFVDWASIKNPDAPNFLGRWRMEIFPIDGVLTCGEINRIARVIFQATRRRHLRVRFNADYVPALKVGRVFTLEGQSGTWRLLSYDAEYIHQGIPTMRAEAILVEAGYA